MNFGSKFVYYYNHSDEESISADSDSSAEDCVDSYSAPSVEPAGLGGSLAKGIGRIGSAVRGFVRSKRSGVTIRSQHDPDRQPASDSIASARGAQDERQGKKKKKVRKSDPNVLTISVGRYVTPHNLHPDNKALTCESCKAVLPAFSKFTAKEGDNNWLCEFCRNYHRSVDVQGWTKPATDDVTYELEPPAVVSCKEKRLEDNHSVVFVIDISGSMSSTKACDIIGANGRRTRTWVSRLDAVKKAAEHQIRQIRDESPNVKVGLITFGTDVIVYGDATNNPQPIASDAMLSQETLKAVAGDFPPLKPISETFNKLTRKLMNLDIKGMTALGPGLLSAISLASNVQGSKVIICTDGCANTGFGELPDDNCTDEDVISESRAVYKSIGDYARDESVTVSVISLEGTDCRLVHLGLVAQITGGVVDIVDPENMTAQFGNILASRTLATSVSVRLILYHTLYIRDQQTGEQNSTKVENLGNVSEDSEMIIEFGVRTVANENEEPMTIDVEDSQAPSTTNQEEQMDAEGSGATAAESGATAAESEATASGSGSTAASTDQQSEPKPSELPFQVQIEFTSRDGGKYRRVITNLRECTEKRETAEAEMNMNIVGQAASNTVSNVALGGNYKLAKNAVKANKKMARRFNSEVMSAGLGSADCSEVYEEYMEEMDELEDLVGRQAVTTKQRSQVRVERSNAVAPLQSFRTSAFSRSSERAAPPPPMSHPYGMVEPPAMIQSAGITVAAGMPQKQKSSTAVNSNFISDDLAHAYYSKSKGSYGQKRKAKQSSKDTGGSTSKDKGASL